MLYKYGLISYNSMNIGDEIQSLAASRFLPNVDYYINRERLSLFSIDSDDERVKLIMNAWYMWRPKRFLPKQFVTPLLISMCIGKRIQSRRFLTRRVKDFLIENGPVGCRDVRTLNFLNENGVPAFFSGCLTSTLLGGERKQKDYILCIDVDEQIVEFVRRVSKVPVYDFTKFMSPYINSQNRMRLAKAFLYILRDAKAAITTNFHTALPAMSFGTPCCLIRPEGDAGDFYGRMMGYENILNAYSKIDFIQGNCFDVNNPPEVFYSDDFLKMKEGLENKCKSFTGFDLNRPMFEDDYNPLLEVIDCLKYNSADVRRVLLHAKRKDLIMAILNRFVGKNHLDTKN